MQHHLDGANELIGVNRAAGDHHIHVDHAVNGSRGVGVIPFGFVAVDVGPNIGEGLLVADRVDSAQMRARAQRYDDICLLADLAHTIFIARTRTLKPSMNANLVILTALADGLAKVDDLDHDPADRDSFAASRPPVNWQPSQLVKSKKATFGFAPLPFVVIRVPPEDLLDS